MFALRSFTVSNYACFREPITLSFVAPADAKAPVAVEGILNKVVLQGVNGSGKTLLGHALFTIVNRLTGQKVYEDAHEDDGRADFRYEFADGPKTVVYEFGFSGEKLTVDGKLVKFKSTVNMSTGERLTYTEPQMLPVIEYASRMILINDYSLQSYGIVPVYAWASLIYVDAFGARLEGKTATKVMGLFKDLITPQVVLSTPWSDESLMTAWPVTSYFRIAGGRIAPLNPKKID